VTVDEGPVSALSRPAASGEAWAHAALAAVVVVLTVFLPAGPWRSAAELAVFGPGLAAVMVALHRHRTTSRVAWWGLGAGLAFFGISSAAETVMLLGVAPGPFSTVEAAFDIAAYAALVVAALGQLAVGRRRRDREAWIDTASLLLAGGLAVLAFTASPGAIGPHIAELGIGTPLLTAAVLLVCVPLAVSDNGRTVSAAALVVAGALTVIGYGGQIVAGPLRDLPILDELPLLAVAAVILAGRHPSVALLGRRAADEGTVTAGRVVGLGAALLISPALLLLWALRHGGTGYLVGAGSLVLTGLALWRLVMLNHERERTRTALAASEQRLQLLLANAADVIAIIDTDGAISYLSPAVQALLGRPAADYLGRSAIELADPRDQARLRAAVATAGEADGAVNGFVDADIRLQHSSGGTRWVEMRISGKVDAVGIDGWVVNLREVTDRKLFEEELRRRATTDPLTGLLNRTAFSERLAEAARDADPAAPPAVLFVDVDDFKTVNDTLGHAAGDELLVTIAARLTADVREDDVVARLGGDEFAVLLATADAARLREVADRLLEGMRRPLDLAGTAVTVTASIGGALGTPGATAEHLLHSADAAMYRAKRGGKNSCALDDAREIAPA
jgi:diguanylate cyclase (GGDEF)-like protein/PAS domain S-box-containing protein